MAALPPRVVAILPRLSPSTWINIVKPLVAMHEAGKVRAWVTLESMAARREVQDADLVVFCRNVQPDRADLLRAAVDAGVPVLYDLDDNFFEIRPDSPIGRLYAQPQHLAMLTEYLSSASLVRVYSRPLLARASMLNSQVEMVASAVDLRQIRSPSPTPDRPLKLVYATSRLDDSLGRIFLPALRRFMDEKGPRVQMHFWGPHPPAELPGVHHHAVVHDYDRFLRRFSAAGFEIGLAPLADDIFHRSKTNTKFREYGACGIAGVYSNVEVYADCVRQGETGLLVSNDTESWYRALRQLADNDALRRQIQQQARREVEENYSQEKFQAVFFRQIEQLVGGARPRRTMKIDSLQAETRRPSIVRIARLIPPAVRDLRRNGWERSWNTLRWISSSACSMAYLHWRLRK